MLMFVKQHIMFLLKKLNPLHLILFCCLQFAPFSNCHHYSSITFVIVLPSIIMFILFVNIWQWNKMELKKINSTIVEF
jgi:hypothetical protein